MVFILITNPTVYAVYAGVEHLCRECRPVVSPTRCSLLPPHAVHLNISRPPPFPGLTCILFYASLDEKRPWRKFVHYLGPMSMAYAVVAVTLLIIYPQVGLTFYFVLTANTCGDCTITPNLRISMSS